MSAFRRLARLLRHPERARRRRARRALDALFGRDARLLEGTSLRPWHRGRTQLIEVLDDPWRIVFGIVRHPRPYAFSRQFHEVLEIWSYDVGGGRVERIDSRNLSRELGTDGRPSGSGSGV